jgi:type IX secretion system PorP/SprF family membrane protein
MKKILIILIIPVLGFSQELQQLSSYMFNQFIYNPAAGGMYETDFNANFSSRIQWAGVDGAPITSYAWADHRFRKNSMSAGLYLNYDRFGARQFTDVAANYAYVVRLTNKLKLSFGLRAGFASLQFDPTSGKVFDQGDPNALAYGMNYPKFGTGVQLYTRKFYLSLGVPDIVSLNNDQNAADKGKSFFQKNRNFVLMAGYKFKLSDGFALYPNAKIFYFSGSSNPPRVDVSLLFEITDYFWAGGNYGSNGSAALMAGTYVSSRLRLMYSYEFFVKQRPTNSFVFNVHEITLMLQLDDLFARKNKDVIE